MANGPDPECMDFLDFSQVHGKDEVEYLGWEDGDVEMSDGERSKSGRFYRFFFFFLIIFVLSFIFTLFLQQIHLPPI